MARERAVEIAAADLAADGPDGLHHGKLRVGQSLLIVHGLTSLDDILHLSLITIYYICSSLSSAFYVLFCFAAKIAENRGKT